MNPTHQTVVKFLIQTPAVVTIKELTKERTLKQQPTCAELMILAAKKAKQQKWPIIQFECPTATPRFNGPGSTSKIVTMVISSLMDIPKTLIHGTAVEDYVKLTPNYRKVLQSFQATA